LLLSKAWETYESDKRIEGFSQQTLKAYRLQAQLIIRYLKDVKLETITTIQLSKVERKLKTIHLILARNKNVSILLLCCS